MANDCNHGALDVSGFTLVELVVTITIIAILAAFAVPRLIDMGSTARAAAVRSLAGAIDLGAYLARSMCLASAASSGCNQNSSAWQGTINGVPYWLNFGWPDAGDALQGGQIDTFVNYSGFRAYIVSNAQTRFVRDDAPTPDQCSVSYFDAYYTPTKYHYIVDVSGC